ncbi:uncharacterized protein K489DRAFT_138471 [Dissoconium aciculare CBS 342.82]|uniref:Uncharacterized protein n=1 Tax=Dissoconium aciculare CBS 342.82 TaxID=1314786 RepID=A0A6J3LPM2_9PEZI|nr:uncharacterized protein K489DRAFT_138471 [Dissoconium aciculare CBS 342.82]KAF1817886.1 hypothetical protein K489DRAFT_138471 [Dissoconium aciculare CBS 342.82]
MNSEYSTTTWQNSTMNSGSDGSTLVGWTLESPGRGTLGLLTTCFVTTSICTWIVIHPRIDDHKKSRIWHKLALWLKTIIAPELIAVEAAQEHMQAQQVIKESAKLIGKQMTLEQAFYVGMFGLRYRTAHGSKVLWPNQFLWLLENNYLRWEDHAEWGFEHEVIKDKSNSDSFAKLFALLQVAGFVGQCLIRAVHNLPLAPLEAMTLGYIPLFAVTYYYWWLKPKDINTPSIIQLEDMRPEVFAEFEALSIDNTFDSEPNLRSRSLRSIWALTPRMFEKQFADKQFRIAQEEYEQKMEDYQLQRLSADHANSTSKPMQLPPEPPRRDSEIVLGHWDPQLYHSKLWPIAILVGISFPALHLISWGAEFPTMVESWLWRVAALTSICGMLIFMQFERVVLHWRDPLMIVKLLSPMLYLVTRMIMLALALAAFRASDPRLYQTYVASSYWVQLI